MYYFYDSVLLVRSHLVIGREAEAAAEEIRADIDSGAFDIGVCATPAVAFCGDKGMGTVDGLHMHGLPDVALSVAFTPKVG